MRWILLPKNVLLASSTARSVTRQLFIVIFVLLLLDWNITSSAGEGHIRHQDILHSDSIIHVYGGSLGRVEHRPTPKVGNRREPSLLSVIQTHISTETSRQSATDFARHETVRTEAKDGTKRRRADQQHHKGKETVMANTMKKPDESSDKERDRRGDNKHSTDHNGNGASSDGDDDSDRMNIQGDKSGTDPHMGGEEQGGNRRVGTEASGPDTRQSELIIITNRITPTLAPELGMHVSNNYTHC